ncbi:MAG: YeeE/YedE thiosulfate transporter family protein [Eubacteriales bacterium]|nr:YeeE/YedE thiosulfate transporter family protein [Eubacteriales bacterium]
MKEKTWLFPAILLGLSFFFAVLWVKPIGVSTQFSVAAGMAQRVFKPTLVYEDAESKSGYASTNAYLNKSGGKLAKAVAHPLNYGMVFVLAIPLGVFLGSSLDSKRRERKQELAKFKQAAKEDKLARKSDAEIINQLNEPINHSAYGLSFLAGLLLIFGARLAGGCTSGHMMSGIMQSSISGYIFALVVFGLAIPLAFLRARKNYKQ